MLPPPIPGGNGGRGAVGPVTAIEPPPIPGGNGGRGAVGPVTAIEPPPIPGGNGGRGAVGPVTAIEPPPIPGGNGGRGAVGPVTAMEPPPIPGGNGGRGAVGPVTATVTCETVPTVDALLRCAVEESAIAGAMANIAKAAPKISLGDWHRWDMGVTPLGDCRARLPQIGYIVYHKSNSMFKFYR